MPSRQIQKIIDDTENIGRYHELGAIAAYFVCVGAPVAGGLPRRMPSGIAAPFAMVCCLRRFMASLAYCLER